MLRFLPETEADYHEAEALLDLAFAPGRTALSSYQLREGVGPIGELCRVVRDDYDALVAAIRFWPVRIGYEADSGRGAPALLLGPIAVHPTRQGEGIAAALIWDALERARDTGWQRAILVGDAPYYGRFGFLRDHAAALEFPAPVNPARVLGKELAKGAFEGLSGPVHNWNDQSQT